MGYLSGNDNTHIHTYTSVMSDMLVLSVWFAEDRGISMRDKGTKAQSTNLNIVCAGELSS